MVIVIISQDTMVIYKAKNKINGKVYIGQTVNKFNKRKVQHLSDAKNNKYPNFKFHRALRKYGKDVFDWDILHKNVCDTNTLNILEQLEITIHDSFNNGYNMTLGGEGFIGYHHSEETKEKIKINNAKYWENKNIPQEMREKISETLKGKYSGEKNPFYGKTHTEETKLIISEKGKLRPIDTYFQISVLQLNKQTGEIINKFPSISSAENLNNINNISASCTGKQKTAGGYLWIYEKDYNEHYIKERIDLIKKFGKKYKKEK